MVVVSRFKCFLLVCLALVITPANPELRAQPQTGESAPLTFSVAVELAQVVVRITNKDGSWVSGVQKDDLQLLEDGLPQEIRYMDEIGGPAPENTVQSAPAAQRSEITVAASLPASVLIIFDACNSGQIGIEKHKRYVKEFLQDFKTSNTLFSIVRINPSGDYEMVQNFTSERSSLLRAVDQMHGVSGGIDEKSANLSKLSDSTQLEQCSSMSGLSRTGCIDGAMRQVIIKARGYATEEQQRSTNSVHSLQRLFELAEHIPGSKSVILVSEGMDPAGTFYYNYAANVIDQWVEHFGLPPSEKSYISEVQMEANRNTSQIGEIRNLIRSANAAGLPIYWVNPEFGKNPEDASSDMEMMVDMTTKLINAPDIDSSMRGLSEDTGGAPLSSTDMSGFYNRIAATIPRYYLLSYKPGRAMNDGTFHKIEVKSKNKNIVLAYGKSFKDFEMKDRIANQLAGAHDFPDVTNQFPVINEVQYFRKGDGNYQVMIHTAINYRNLAPQVSADTAVDDIGLSFIVRDAKGEIILETSPTLKIRGTYSEYMQLKNTEASLDYLQPYTLAPGGYQISLAVMDVAGWRTSSASNTIRLPDRSDPCLSIAPLMLASRRTQSGVTTEAAVPTEKGEIQYKDSVYSFSAVRVFPRDGALSGFYQIYNAAGTGVSPSVRISFSLYGDKTGLINQTPEHEIGSYTDSMNHLISNFFSVPYKNLAPGKYELEIRARDGVNGCSASSRAAFEIGM